MNDDDKTVYAASEQFSEVVDRLGASPIYQATDRHGLLEWAAQLKPKHGIVTYLTLGMWELAEPEKLGLRASVAQLGGAMGKTVRDFPAEVSVEHDLYSVTKHAVGELLEQAIEVAESDFRDSSPVASDTDEDDYELEAAARNLGIALTKAEEGRTETA